MNEGDDGSSMSFEVAGEAPKVADPGEGSFDDPAFWEHLEAGNVVALDDLEAPATGFRDGFGHHRSLIAAIGEDHLDEREGPPRLAEEFRCPVAILDIRGMDHDPEHQAQRIDEDVTLAPRDLLAGVVALRVDRGPPFCAALALWLSMMAAVGLASRPACSRQLK